MLVSSPLQLPIIIGSSWKYLEFDSTTVAVAAVVNSMMIITGKGTEPELYYKFLALALLRLI